jgi:hypothetical protein
MRINRDQITSMLEMQSGMNAKVNPAWLDAGYPFLRAVVVEGGEAMDHKGWKWWKHQEADLPQVQMELVDIWHFLSLPSSSRPEAISKLLLNGWKSASPHWTARKPEKRGYSRRNTV